MIKIKKNGSLVSVSNLDSLNGRVLSIMDMDCRTEDEAIRVSTGLAFILGLFSIGDDIWIGEVK